MTINLKNGVELTGEASIPAECHVVLHFSTKQHPNSLPKFIRKTRAASQFLYYEPSGNFLKGFSLNREVLGNAMLQLDNDMTIYYSDFNLYCDIDKASYVDDQSLIDLPAMTIFAPTVTGYLEEKNTGYALLNLGSGAISGQYTSILRFANAKGTYDVILPHSLNYIAYDTQNDRFIYRVSGSSDEFKYGFVTFDSPSGKYIYNQPSGNISRKSINQKFGDYDNGYNILINGDHVYEIIPCNVNEQIAQDLSLSRQYVNNGQWGVLILHKYDLITGNIESEYLISTPIYDEKAYGFIMSGTQQMPVSCYNDELYVFTADQKMNIYSPEKGFRQYDIKFDFSGTIAPSNLFDSKNAGGPTLGDGSPLRIENDGSVYVAHAYQDGKIKIHKYNFETQTFTLYWESAESVVDKLIKDSLTFQSFELLQFK